MLLLTVATYHGHVSCLSSTVAESQPALRGQGSAAHDFLLFWDPTKYSCFFSNVERLIIEEKVEENVNLMGNWHF